MTFDYRTFVQKDIPDMHNAFNAAFADYVISMKVDEKAFRRKIIQKTNIEFNYSVGAYTGNKLAGFIFTAIGDYENKKSAYNGGTGVLTEYRGFKLTRKMYEFLIPKLIDNQVEQCVLEVISDNRPAIKAYESIGFKKTKFYHCLKLNQESGYLNKRSLTGDYDFLSPVEPKWEKYNSFCDFGTSFLDTFSSLKVNQKNENFLEIYKGDKLLGFIIFNKHMGRIEHLAVHPDYRGKGIGTILIKKALQECGNKPIYILNIDERYYGLLNFFLRLGFINEIDQFELGLKLPEK